MIVATTDSRAIRWRPLRAPWLRAALVAVAVSGCTGGSGGPGGGGSPGDVFDPLTDFYLTGGYFARPIFDLTGGLVDVVNPASLQETDPVTGIVLPGFPKVLVPGTSLASLVSLNFEQIQDPLTPQVPLVPRNAALVLEFSMAIDAASLKLAAVDASNTGDITSDSPLQVRRQDGSLVPTRARVTGNRIILHAITGGAPGWEASPLVFDKFGTAVEDITGFLRVVTGTGTAPLRTTTGQVLVDRPDQLGTLGVPLPFNPGNSKLDAIVLESETGTIRFNGFLPDLTSPRLIRPVQLTDTIDEIHLVPSGADLLVEITGAVLPAPANVAANGGAGEWAQALMEVTGAGGTVTRYVVLKNVNEAVVPHRPVFRLVAGTVLDGSVMAGSSFTVSRSEFYEPIPPPLPVDADALAQITVDPEHHPRDAADPQDLVNHDLRRFVRMFGEDGVERTDRWDPAAGVFQSVPPRTSLRLRFSEAMDVTSFRPYECFSVMDLTVSKVDAGFRQMRIGRAVASPDSRDISFEPTLVNQLDPSADEFIGFGGSATSLKLLIRTIPEPSKVDSIVANASPDQLAKLVDLDEKGVLGITDLGGRGLGLPAAMTDLGDTAQFLMQPTSVGLGPFPPAADLEMPFQTEPTADPDYGVIVHRFLGRPSSSIFTYPVGSVHDEVTSGAEYFDLPPDDLNGDGVIERRYIYGPRVFDIGLNLPGRLTGAPASTIQHIVDDFNAPKISPFASPLGEDKLIALGFGAANPLNAPFGVRFQHVYRPGDASPAYMDFNGVILDLVGLAWSPFSNVITNTTVQDMELLVGLAGTNAGKGPDTNQQNGIPFQNGATGLGDQFDCNVLDNSFNCCFGPGFPTDLKKLIPGEPKMATVVRPGTQYPISGSKLFVPANATGLPKGSFNLYIDYPEFNAGVDPYFGKSDVFSWPYDSLFPMLIEYRLKPNAGNVPPASLNFFRFSPGVLSSALPRFRVWSQGQDPLARCVPNFANGGAPGQIPCSFKSGEGGPLVEPGTYNQPIQPPLKNNGMPTIFPKPLVSPPFTVDPACPLAFSLQPEPDFSKGQLPTQTTPLILPTCNTHPETNWYFANGMNAYPLPNTTCYPGAAGFPPTTWVGYGPAPASGACPVVEPGYTCEALGTYGDNSRYYMMWKYRKRISRIESPTLLADSGAGLVHYLRPIVEPPLADVDPDAGLSVEFKAGTQMDFAIPALDSGYVSQVDPDFEDKLTGIGGFAEDRIFVKFRATFATAKGETQPPFVDTVVIPYIKVGP